MSDLELVANTIAVSNPVLARHPGAVNKTDFYASSARTDIQAALAFNANGKQKITSNNLRLGATSNFSISDSVLIYGVEMCASITCPANNGPQCEGWLFQAIQSIQVTLVGVDIPALTIPGYLIREYMLACCPDRETRSRLLRNAGQVGTTGAAVSASIPLGWVLASGLGTMKDFPIDLGFFRGPIQFSVSFNTSNYFITGTGTGAAAPANTTAVTSFDSLYLKYSSTDVKSSQFRVRNIWSQDPAMDYYIPGEYLQYTHFSVSASVGNQVTLNLQAAPAGMIEAMVLVIKPQVEFSSTVGSAATYIYPGSVELSSLECTFGGDVIFSAESDYEIKQFYRTHFDGDDRSYDYEYLGPSIAATGAVTNAGADVVSRDAVFRGIMKSSVYLIPMCYSGNSTLSGPNTENLISYSGKALTLKFTPKLRSRVSTTSGFAQIALADTVGGGAGAQDYSVDILYVSSAVFGGQPDRARLYYEVPNNIV